MFDSDDDDVEGEPDDGVNDGVSSSSNNSNVPRRRGVSSSLYIHLYSLSNRQHNTSQHTVSSAHDAVLIVRPMGELTDLLLLI